MTTPLVVMAKAPRPGQVKTRLARLVGTERATALARSFLQDVWRQAATTPDFEAVLALEGRPEDLPPLTPRPGHVEPQQGDCLGRRMLHALAPHVARCGAALVIGSDSPTLPLGRLRDAAAMLEHADAVFIPAEDGGFCAMGLRSLHLDLLDDLPWSRADTLARTVERLEARGYRVATTRPWIDIDEAGDLTRVTRLLQRGALDAPATARVLADYEPKAPPSVAAESPLDRAPPPVISVVIPTLDEARALPERLRELDALEGIAEVVVSDGESQDDTARVAADWPGVRLVTGPRGRGPQLDRGARAARGQVLLFLHADVSLPAEAATHIRAALSHADAVGGCFKTHHVPDRRPRMAPLLRLADGRSRYHPHPYGDQAIFVRREAFEAAGGFGDLPLMEDLAFSRRLAAHGRIVRCDATVKVSGRRMEAAPLKYVTLINVFPLLWALGVSERRLLQIYHHVR